MLAVRYAKYMMYDMLCQICTLLQGCHNKSLSTTQDSATPEVPVVVWISCIHACLYALEEVAQLAFVQLKLLNKACSLNQMESQQGKGAARRGICKGKYIKLPVLLCTLQAYTAWFARLSCVILIFLC